MNGTDFKMKKQIGFVAVSRTFKKPHTQDGSVRIYWSEATARKALGKACASVYHFLPAYVDIPEDEI